MAKHLVHHSYKEKEKLSTRQNSNMEIHICAMGTWKKHKQMRELRLLWWPSLVQQCVLYQSSALKLMNLKGGLLCFYLFSDLYILVLYRLVNPVNQKLNLQTSVNSFSFFFIFYLTRTLRHTFGCEHRSPTFPLLILCCSNLQFMVAANKKKVSLKGEELKQEMNILSPLWSILP